MLAEHLLRWFLFSLGVPQPLAFVVPSRGCHKDAHPFFFYYGIHSLMFGGYPPTAISYPPTAIGYTPTAIGYPPTAIGYPLAAIVGRIGHSEFFFSFITAPPGALTAHRDGSTYGRSDCIFLVSDSAHPHGMSCLLAHGSVGQS